MNIHYKLWIEENDEVLFGEGRMALLKAVEENGSLAGAARALSMSYRAAWGRIKASEQRLGFSLVERSDKGRRAVKLTDKALKIMQRYQALDEKAQAFAKQYKSEWRRELSRLRK